MKRRSLVSILGFVVLSACLAPAKRDDRAPVLGVFDGFESGKLDRSKWTIQQIWYGNFFQEDQLDFAEGDARCGKSYARMTSRPKQIRKNSDISERAEIRTHFNDFQKWGETIWYGYSFRVAEGTVGPGSPRTIVGQWKSPEPKSDLETGPFLAQRYDNGVFHITVENAVGRATVACGVGNPHARMKYLDFPIAFGCHQDRGGEPVPANITVVPSPNPVLPDPGKGWVDMQVGIKGGNRRSTEEPITEGRVEIWANDALITTVTGDLGIPLLTKPTDDKQYFKFGIYRDAGMPDELKVHFDEFRRGTSREDVLPGCPRT